MGAHIPARHPLVVFPDVAKALGDVELALLLQQVHYWLGKSKNVRDGRRWVYNSAVEWQEQFQWMSERTIRRKLSDLADGGLLLVGNYNAMKIDRTKWYAIDYEACERRGIVFDRPSDNLADHVDNLADHRSAVADQHPDLADQYQRLTTETTPETTSIPPAQEPGPTGGVEPEKKGAGGEADQLSLRLSAKWLPFSRALTDKQYAKVKEAADELRALSFSVSQLEEVCRAINGNAPPWEIVNALKARKGNAYGRPDTETDDYQRLREEGWK